MDMDPRILSLRESGNNLFDKGDYEQAIATYNEAIKLDDNYPALYSDRGQAYFKKGDYKKAISDFKMALDGMPSNEFYQKQHNEALAVFEVEDLIKGKKIIRIGSIVGAIIGVIISIIACIVQRDIAAGIAAAIVAIWMGVGFGGNITFFPRLLNTGGRVWGWWSPDKTFVSNIGQVLFNSIIGFLIAWCGLWVFGFTGPIWALVRFLIKRNKLKKLQLTTPVMQQ